MTRDLIIAILINVAIGGLLIWAGFRTFKRCRLILDTPRSKSASAAQGFVELQGHAWPIEAPYPTVTGHLAVYYSFELQRKESEGSGKKKRTVWRTKASAGTSGPFFLVDPTGLTLIDDKGITRELEGGTTTSWNSLTEQQKNAVIELTAGSAPSDFPPSSKFFGLFSSSYRISEQAIYMGSPVHAAGHFQSAGDSQPHPARIHGLTQFFARTMDEKARTERNIDSAIDRDRNGKISVREAIDGYASLAAHSWNSAGDISEEREFMIHGSLESSLEHGLHISDKQEEHLVRALKFKYWLGFALGSLFVAAGIALPLTEKGNKSQVKNESANQVTQSIESKHEAKYRFKAPVQSQTSTQTTPTDFHKEACQTNSRACWEQFTNALQPFDVSNVPVDMKLAVVKLQLHDLHYTCGGGVAEACEVLLSVPKEAFGLTSQHQTTYARRGCELGNTKLCEWRAPASK